MRKPKRRREGRKAWRVVGRYGHEKPRAITVHAPTAGLAILHFVLQYPDFWAKSWGESRLIARRIYGRN